MNGIEPSSSAWKAVALPLSYTREIAAPTGAKSPAVRRDRPLKTARLSRSQMDGPAIAASWPVQGQFVHRLMYWMNLQMLFFAGALFLGRRRRSDGRLLAFRLLTASMTRMRFVRPLAGTLLLDDASRNCADFDVTAATDTEEPPAKASSPFRKNLSKSCP